MMHFVALAQVSVVPSADARFAARRGQVSLTMKERQQGKCIVAVLSSSVQSHSFHWCIVRISIMNYHVEEGCTCDLTTHCQCFPQSISTAIEV